jgi:iron(III) transport system permease protein
MIWNTFLYCGAAALIDVVIGTAIAYLVLRTRLPGRQLLDHMATVALAMPGVVLGIGYLRAFRGIELPFTETPFVASWLVFVLAYSVRRLPYALRSCTAALHQVHVSLEEAAQNLGASQGRTILRIVVPMMAGGIAAGFVTSFVTAAVEISETILLTSRESLAPMSYGIYLYMQSIAGRGPGAALGVIAVIVVAIGTYFSHRFVAARASHQERRT